MEPLYLNKVNRQNIGFHFFDFMLVLIGKTRVDVIDDDDWKHNWHISRNNYDILRDHCIKEAKKTFKCNRTKAESIFEWFYKEFGLRIKN